MKKFSGAMLVIILFLLLDSCSKSSTEELEQLYAGTNLENDKAAVDPGQIEEGLLNLINQHRISMGLNTLEKIESVYKYAEEHNDYMISKNSLSHDNFETRAANIANETNALIVSENVARYYTSAQKTMEAWTESTTHKKAMEGDFSHTSLSVQLDKEGRPYYTQIFIKVE